MLIVTASPERAYHLSEICAQIRRGRGLFLFTDADTLRGRVVPYTHENVFDLPWLTASGGTERLADSFALRAAA